MENQTPNKKSRILKWLLTTNHKDIGILYFVTSLTFFIIAGILALLMRTQLAIPSNNFLNAEEYNQAVTMHGLIMLLWFLSPLGVAFANYFVPLQIGARDLAFPRLNALSYWLYLFSGIIAASGFILGGAADVGWTYYAPLTAVKYSPGPGVTLGAAAIAMISASVTIGTINFLVTIAKLRAPGMKLIHMPLYVWFILFTMILMLIAFPPLLGAAILLLSDRVLGTSFFNSVGAAIIWDNLFWFFGHPEVYILLLPGFGIIPEVLSVFSRRPVYGKKIIIASLAVATLLSITVWGHHMYVTGVSKEWREYMNITTEIISIPFGLIVISFIATLVGGAIRLKTPLLFALGSIFLFVIGGSTGVFQSSVALDYQFRGTYWVVGHFHYVLVGATIFGLFAGIYYWFPKITGRMYNEKLGKLHFLISFIGFNILYFPMFLLIDMPRRIWTYQPNTGWGELNMIATIGAFIFGPAQLLLFYNLYKSMKHGDLAGANPWGGWTLEWATSSPPPPEDFPGIPDLRTGVLHFVQLDGSGLSEVGANHSNHLSKWPIIISLSLALFLFGVSLWPLNVAGSIIFFAGVIIGLYALIGWSRDDIKEHFKIPEEPMREQWPFEKADKIKLGVWILVFSEMLLFATLIGTYAYYRYISPTWPAPGTIHDIRIGTVNTLILLTSSFTLIMALVFARVNNLRGLKIGLILTFGLGLLFLIIKGFEWSELMLHNFTFSSGLPASTYYITTGTHAAHVIAGLGGLLYLIAKTFNGNVKVNTVESFGIYWHFVDIVWIFLFPLFYLL
jgi:cytochrome c oxidase subunit I+III